MFTVYDLKEVYNKGYNDSYAAGFGKGCGRGYAVCNMKDIESDYYIEKYKFASVVFLIISVILTIVLISSAVL